MAPPVVVLVALAVASASCGGSSPPADADATATATAAPPTALIATAPARAPASPTPPGTPAPTPTLAASSASEPRYEAVIVRLSDELRQAMQPSSWRPGCPVGLDDLRLVTLGHWGYDGEARTGSLIVHADWAEPIAAVFGALFDARFPIERMELVDVYAGDDQASMLANNTSAFNCREVAYRPGVWSNHAYGRAIDINPLVNPYVDGAFVDPAAGAPFVDRTLGAEGMITAGDAVVAAFAAIGWTWGGDWVGAQDYQHFDAP